jgi:hypothetical protein
MRRRTRIMDVLAARMFPDGMIEGKPATWARMSTLFAQVLPEVYTAADLDNKVVTQKVLKLLKGMTANAAKFKDGKAEDLAQVIVDIPRKQRQKKSVADPL